MAALSVDASVSLVAMKTPTPLQPALSEATTSATSVSPSTSADSSPRGTARATPAAAAAVAVAGRWSDIVDEEADDLASEYTCSTQKTAGKGTRRRRKRGGANAQAAESFIGADLGGTRHLESVTLADLGFDLGVSNPRGTFRQPCHAPITNRFEMAAYSSSPAAQCDTSSQTRCDFGTPISPCRARASPFGLMSTAPIKHRANAGMYIGFEASARVPTNPVVMQPHHTPWHLQAMQPDVYED